MSESDWLQLDVASGIPWICAASSETFVPQMDSGNIQTQVSADGTVTVGLKKDLTVNSVTAGDSKLDTNDLTIIGGPSVTKAGIDAGNKKVTNVADGTIGAGSKDAINGGQLHTALNNINSNIAAL